MAIYSRPESGADVKFSAVCELADVIFRKIEMVTEELNEARAVAASLAERAANIEMRAAELEQTAVTLNNEICAFRNIISDTEKSDPSSLRAQLIRYSQSAKMNSSINAIRSCLRTMRETQDMGVRLKLYGRVQYTVRNALRAAQSLD